ncbi:para-nitrobenzyl esterase [Didymella exigua CBS 183.55]|uniref:Carboxylic ester hydrolase n=1 Tax=Didymella exigua CBS 183.55 TaxID=1150837 RepID=A0A6A5RIC0_9PLEO|nr:para-nitrobenzyl esterase [Didymella exigua CBS 183.55]KAF1927329.1 para-nitrobenzyl esterase [Didymella exigua CBS 183.55]
MKTGVFASVLGSIGAAAHAFHVDDASCGVTYRGIERDGLQHFYGIRYGQDTSGENRFKPPRLYVPTPGSVVDATKPGIACPQPLGNASPPLSEGNVTEVSEDCLNLNIIRPKLNATRSHGKLPVMVWIHGGKAKALLTIGLADRLTGSFWWGSNMEPTFKPDGLIRQSVEGGHPVIHVAMNYRLGFFGFTQSDSLKEEGSENAGLRDQRLAIEWVRDNIGVFGGDPENITIFGQSSGGLAIGMHILAYGGAKPPPFQRAIAESQSLEPGLTGNFSRDALSALVEFVGCNTTGLQAPKTISCLRGMATDTLLNASITTYANDIGHNVGDIWLPVVDGDFLPAPPSQLIDEGRFGNVTLLSGWAQDDLNFYTDVSIATSDDTYNFMRSYLPAMPEESLDDLLGLYPVAEFTPPSGTNLTAEFYRSARMFRDILMVCPPLYLGAAMHKTYGGPVYHYDFNQTILDPILEHTINVSHLGVVHTSEFAYVFGNVEAYNVSGNPINVTASDYALQKCASRSWSAFATTGNPIKGGEVTVQGWLGAYIAPNQTHVMTVGGPWEGWWPLSGADSPDVVSKQKLVERCAFLNSPDIIRGLQY